MTHENNRQELRFPLKSRGELQKCMHDTATLQTNAFEVPCRKKKKKKKHERYTAFSAKC